MLSVPGSILENGALTVREGSKKKEPLLARGLAPPKLLLPMPSAAIAPCLFCEVVNRKVPARLVFEDEISLAFLDHRPVFPGHCLLIPKIHYETLTDLPEDLIGPFFKRAQLLARAVESAMAAEGTFVAMNNRVSQNVP